MPSYLIVLLGNPGEKYADTRHNIAWWVGDLLAERRRLKFHRDGDSLLAEGRVGGKPVCLQKPLTYMNESGREVVRSVQLMKLTPDEIIVVSDDIDLELGTIRVRAKGSSGGHRGLESIFQHIGTDQVTRCRCGVGPTPAGVDASDFVLDRFSDDQLIVARHMVGAAADAVEMILARGPNAAANTFNRKPSASGETAKEPPDAQRPREDE